MSQGWAQGNERTKNQIQMQPQSKLRTKELFCLLTRPSYSPEGPRGAAVSKPPYLWELN